MFNTITKILADALWEQYHHSEVYLKYDNIVLFSIYNNGNPIKCTIEVIEATLKINSRIERKVNNITDHENLYDEINLENPDSIQQLFDYIKELIEYSKLIPLTEKWYEAESLTGIKKRDHVNIHGVGCCSDRAIAIQRKSGTYPHMVIPPLGHRYVS